MREKTKKIRETILMLVEFHSYDLVEQVMEIFAISR